MEETIFYIVIGVIIFIVSVMRNNKKKTPTQKRPIDFSDHAAENHTTEEATDPRRFLSEFQRMLNNEEDLIPRTDEVAKKPVKKVEPKPEEPIVKKKELEEKKKASDFDLKSAIIYSEILKRKYE